MFMFRNIVRITLLQERNFDDKKNAIKANYPLKEDQNIYNYMLKTQGKKNFLEFRLEHLEIHDPFTKKVTY